MSGSGIGAEGIVATNVDVVALINERRGRLAVWHVVVDPTWPMSRLCGAWMDSTASELFAERYLLPFEGRELGGFGDVESVSAGIIDVDKTRSAVTTAIADLDVLHRNSPTKSGTARAAISWPRVPEPLDWTMLPVPPRGVLDDSLTSETIAVARWVADLADAWSGVETIRCSRKHLAGADTNARPFPVILRN